MKILLVEDSDTDVLLAQRFIPEGTELRAVKSKAEFESAIGGDYVPDLMIVDYRLPGWSGVDASEAIRKRWPNMPVLVLTGTLVDEMLPPLESHHIDDVLLKDRPHRLAWAVRKAVRDREREEALRKASEQAIHALEALRRASEQALEVQRLQTVGEVATGLAHDMRNMLTPIMGVLHMFEPYIPEDKLNLLRAAQRSADRMVDMINRMMLFVSGRNGHKENVSVRALILEFLQFLQTLVPEVVIKSDITTKAVISIDPTVVRQVILNFCVNARDAGARNVHLSATDVNLVNHRPAVGGGQVSGAFCRIGVQDDGSGVAPEIVERIFEPFFTTKPVGKGTGLGLSTVRNIVQQFGGFVDVTPALQMGSIFSAYFATGK